MTSEVYLKLLAIFVVVAMGWLAGRVKLFGGGEGARTLSNTAFYLFAPALLFRTTARIDFTVMPWATLAAYFVPVVGWMLVIYVHQRFQAEAASAEPAQPGVRAITGTFSNTVQLGIPVIAALFGEAGLLIHLTIVSMHSLTLLTVVTVLVEFDLAQAASSRMRGSLAATLRTTARNTLIHPVVLPVLVGIAWNGLGWPIPAGADEVLQILGQAVIPVCLIAIGMSLAHHGLQSAGRGALVLSAAKLVVQPALVLLAGLFVFGLRGMPLAAIVLCAALPAGVNSLLFSQRYATREAETTATLVLSTLIFAVTGPLWLWVLTHL